MNACLCCIVLFLTPPMQKLKYYPLIVIVSYVIIGALCTSFSASYSFMGNLMGYFFFLFSLFKMLDVPGFARAYAKYDIVAGSIPLWGKIYPFVELGLAVLYLSGQTSASVHVVTAILMGIGLVGVTRSVLDKQKIKCACLGTGFDLPMSTVTIIEDGLMLLMALWMLI